MPRYECLEILWDHILQKHGYMTKEIIDEVLEEPCNEKPTQHDGRRRFWKTIGGDRYLVVVKEHTAYEAYVITAYRLEPQAKSEFDAD